VPSLPAKAIVQVCPPRATATIAARIFATCAACSRVLRWRARATTPLRRAALLALACWTCAASALAEAPRSEVELTWLAPTSRCPDAAAVRARIAAALSANGASGPVSVAARVLARSSDFVLELAVVTEGQRVERVLEARACAVLAESVAWLVALALRADGDHVAAPRSAAPDTRSPQPEREQARAAPPLDASSPRTPTVTPQQATEPTASPGVVQPELKREQTAPHAAARERAARVSAHDGTTERQASYRIGAALGVRDSGLAGPAAQLALALGLATGGMDLDLQLGHVFRRTRSLMSGARVGFSAQVAELALGYHWQARQLAAGPLAQLSLARLRPHVEGLATANARPALLLSGGLGARLFFRLGPTLLALEGLFSLPLGPRPRFTVENGGTAGEVRYVAGSLRLAWWCHFE